jgi:hypothetical protein
VASGLRGCCTYGLKGVRERYWVWLVVEVRCRNVGKDGCGAQAVWLKDI